MKPVNPLLRSAILLAAAISAPATAATNPILWSGATDSVWGTGTNWSGDVAPADNLSSDSAVFNLSTYPFQPNAATRSVAGLVIGDGSTTTAPLTITGVLLNLGEGGIDMKANAGPATVNTAVTLGAAQTWRNESTDLLSAPAGTGAVDNAGFGLGIDGSGPLSIGRILAGAGALTKAGAGTLTLSGVNTMTGVVNVNGGILTSAAASTATGCFLGGPGSSGTHRVVNIASGAQVKYDGGANTFLQLGGAPTTDDYGVFYDFNISGTLAINDGAAASQILQSTYNLSNGGVITNTGAAHTGLYGLLFGWNGAGGGNINVTGTGNQIASDRIGFFNGATITLTSGADLAISSIIKNGSATVSALTTAGSGTVTLTGANSYTGLTTVASGITLRVGDGGTAGTLGSGAVTHNGTLIFNRSDSQLATGAISGNGTLEQAGSGTLILTGANTYVGTTTISAGTLQIGNAGTSGQPGTGEIVNNDALTINRSNALTLANTISGSGTLIHNGSGTTTLSGTSSYSGETAIYAGRLNLTGTLAASELVLAGGGLGGEGSAKSITLDSGTLHVDPQTPGTITASNGLSTTGGLIQVSPTGPLPAPGPIAVIHYSGAFTGSLADFVFAGTTRSSSVTNVAGTISLDPGAANRTWGGADGTWEVGGSGSAWVEGDQKFFDYDLVSFPDPVGPKTVTLIDTLRPSSTTVTNSTGNDYTFSGGTLAGAGGLTKNGTGTLIISDGTHTYTGPTTVNAGVLRYLGAVNTLASTFSGTGTIEIGTRASGLHDWGASAVFSSSFTGLIDVQAGNTNGFRFVAMTNQLTSNMGDLNVGSGSILAVNGVVNSSSTLQFDALSGAGTIHNGAVASVAPSTVILGANNGTGTYSGNFTSSSANNGRISLVKNGSGTQTLGGTVNSGNGTLTVNAGTLIMSATGNTLGGAFAVNGGTLKVNGTKTGAGAVTVATTGTLGGSGSIAGAVTVQSGGTLAPGNEVGNLSFTSTVNLQAGSSYVAEIASAASNDKITATGALTLNGSVKVTLTGGYIPTANAVFDLADATIAGTPVFDFSAATLPAGMSWDTSSFATNGTIKVISSDVYGAWASANNVTGGKNGDDDNDGVSNFLEFATAANPKSGASVARVYPLMHVLGGQKVLTYTVAVRAAASFAANGVKQQSDKDGVRYVVEGSDQLGTWSSVVVSELAPADATAVQAALGAQLNGLDAAWQWHSFRTDGDAASDLSDFIRLNVTETP